MTRIADHSPVLGTVVQTRIDADDTVAGQAESAILAEFERLDAVFSTYRSDSELSEWSHGGGPCSPELTAVLAAAEYWWQESHGAFHPAVGHLRAHWLLAADSDGPPPRLPASLEPTTLPFRVVAGEVVRVSDCS